MAHSELEIVPAFDVEMLNHSQSPIPLEGLFLWTFVNLIVRPVANAIGRLEDACGTFRGALKSTDA